MEFNLAGPLLAVRPYCHNNDYWQVYFDTNRAIREVFGIAGFPIPEQHVVVRTVFRHSSVPRRSGLLDKVFLFWSQAGTSHTRTQPVARDGQPCEL